MLKEITYCEICGKHETIAALHKHHIKHRAAGGKDIEENVIKLCGECHAKCHAGNIKIGEQIIVVAARLNKTPEEVWEKISSLNKDVLPANYVFSAEDNPLKGMALEDVLQIYCNFEEIGEQTIWEKAKILSGLVDGGLKIKAVSSFVGCSPATVRERIKTYKAFPDSTIRAADLSFTHHRIAAKTNNPVAWIDKTCQEGLSTRQLEDAIKEECEENTITRDVRLEKAERALRMIKEIIEEKDEASTWLEKEVLLLLGGKVSEPEAFNFAC